MLIVLLVALVVGVGVIYSSIIEPQCLKIRRLSVTFQDLDQTVRILFASDFHANVGQAGRLKRLVNRLSEFERPDFLIFGGDLLHKGTGLVAVKQILAILRSLDLPTFAVLGNHDIMSGQGGETSLKQLLEEYGIGLLQNAEVVIGVIGQKLPIQLFYPSQYREVASKMSLLSSIDQASSPRILVCHNPDGIYLPIAGEPPQLVLSGHTHGGQVFWLLWVRGRLKRLIQNFLPAGSFESFAGFKPVGSQVILVSRVVSGRPFRCGRTPEIHLVELRPTH